MTPEDERFCLKELARGNKSAFEWLFMTWHARLVGFLSRRIGDESTAYDYAQDIFFDIWKQRKKFSEVESFSAYLFQMARFRVYNHFDKVAVKSRFRGEMAARASVPPPTEYEPVLFASETESQIWEAVRHLPAKRRKVFIMSRMQGFSNDEIAQELGINKRTVENHITNALASLRKIVK